MTDLDAIRARHHPGYRSHWEMEPDHDIIIESRCAAEGGDWPCDTAIVLAALDKRERQRDGARVSAAACQAALDAALARERRLREAAEPFLEPTYVDNDQVIAHVPLYRLQALRAALAETSEPD